MCFVNNKFNCDGWKRKLIKSITISKLSLNNDLI